MTNKNWKILKDATRDGLTKDLGTWGMTWWLLFTTASHIFWRVHCRSLQSITTNRTRDRKSFQKNLVSPAKVWGKGLLTTENHFGNTYCAQAKMQWKNCNHHLCPLVSAGPSEELIFHTPTLQKASSTLTLLLGLFQCGPSVGWASTPTYQQRDLRQD